MSMADVKSTSGSGRGGQPTFIKRTKKRKAGTPMTNPPLTPLIDVFLFLIIFFLLGCKFAQFEGTIPANLPATQSGTGDSPNEIALDPIKVSLRPVGEDGVNVSIAIEGPIGKRTVENMRELCNLLTEYGVSHKVVGPNVPRARSSRSSFTPTAGSIGASWSTCSTRPSGPDTPKWACAPAGTG